MDVMDVAGEQQNDLNKRVLKVRLDRRGQVIPESQSIGKASKEVVVAKQCGDCYGAVPPSSGIALLRS